MSRTNTSCSMMSGFLRGRGAKLAGKTLWGAYNAVAEWADHTRYDGKKLRSRSSQFESVIWGSSRQIKTRAFGRAVEMSKRKRVDYEKITAKTCCQARSSAPGGI